MSLEKLFLLFLVVFCSQCEEKKSKAPLNMLQKNRLLWSSKNIKNYQVTQQIICYCPWELVQPKNVVVRDGKIFSINDSLVSPEQNTFKTVDTFFEFIELETNNESYEIHIDYDETYGFPNSIYVDRSEKMIDEEVNYKLSNFILLE